jgi:hypothetical protein
MNGKGSKPRPLSVPRSEYDEKFSKINWNKNEKPPKKDEKPKK